MRYGNLDLLHFMPVFMREDATAKGFAYAVQNQLNRVIAAIVNTRIYSNIGSLDNDILDELAWQFNIPEYASALDIAAKRLLVKNCMQTHRQRGTPKAVEKVTGDIFGEGRIEEWFTYGGDPYHFRVVTSNSAVTGDQAEQFAQAIETVKNIRSVLDQVIIEMAAELPVYFGNALHIGKIYTVGQVV